MTNVDENRDSIEVVSAALPYVNGPPHVGHALEIVQADALARCRRLLGSPARLITGSDENSLKNVRAAEELGISPAQHVAVNAARFVALTRALGAELHGFVRTGSDASHARTVGWVFEQCRQRGDVYKRLYRGLFCVGCEQFYRESELVAGLCPEHATAPELVEEENYFFRLSRYEDALRAAIESDAIQIVPAERKREVLRFIEGGLEDFSVSRSVERAKGWGIRVPGDDSQVVFVWFDALCGYLTALERDGVPGWEVWRTSTRRTHVIGKGIVRFHAVYWPAVLLSAGLPLPQTVSVHGYLTVQGKKIGKSLGNAIDPFALVEDWGADALRYYLLRHVATGLDGDFELGRLAAVYGGELANQLGNLVQRSCGLVARHAGGKLPTASDGEVDAGLRRAAEGCVETLEQAAADCDVRRGVAGVFQLVAEANRFIERSEPWALAKHGERARLDAVLSAAVEAVRVIGVALSPFLPATAAEIARRVGGGGLRWGEGEPRAGVAEGPPLFPRRCELR